MTKNAVARDTRIAYIDIAKGVAILIVVFGHSGLSWVNPYISWIQMPIFFFLGGLVFKNAHEKRSNNIVWSLNKIRIFATPYIVFGLLTYYGFKHINPAILPTKYNLIYGGMNLRGIYGVYWFITVYLFTLLVFNLISQLRSPKFQMILIAAMYMAGHILAIRKGEPIPRLWNLDVVLITTTYFASGYYLKNVIDQFVSKWAVALASTIFITIFTLQLSEIINLEIDLKYKQYSNPFLDFLVHMSWICIFIFTVVYFEKILSFFKYFGRASLYIMYLHIPINTAIAIKLQMTINPIIFAIVGMVLPTVIYYLVHLVLDRKDSVSMFIRNTKFKPI